MSETGKEMVEGGGDPAGDLGSTATTSCGQPEVLHLRRSRKDRDRLEPADIESSRFIFLFILNFKHGCRFLKTPSVNAKQCTCTIKRLLTQFFYLINFD
jgi:hypothetical protein